MERGYGTLYSHLQRVHSDVSEVSDLLQDRSKMKEAQIPTSKQTITQILKAKGSNPLPKDGAESVRLHPTILEMIALHNLAFTILEDVGMIFVFLLLYVMVLITFQPSFYKIVSSRQPGQLPRSC